MMPEFLNFTICDFLSIAKDRQKTRNQSVSVNMDSRELLFNTNPVISEEIEDVLSRIFCQPVILLQHSTQTHFDIIPAIVSEQDAVIVDNETNSNIVMASDLLKNIGVHVESLPHNRMDLLADKLQKLNRKYRKIWYFASGVYSTYGDTLPVEPIVGFLEQFTQFHIYTDDSFGMSWIGENGKGFVNHHIPNHPRLITFTSLSTGFGAIGGIITCFDDKIKNKLVSTIIKQSKDSLFNQNSLINILNSAKNHLSDDIYDRQAELKLRIDFFNRSAINLGLPIRSTPGSPIGFIASGKHGMCHELRVALMNKGFYTYGTQFSELTEPYSGIRIMIGIQHSKKDIKSLLVTLKDEFDKVLKNRNITLDSIMENYSFNSNFVKMVE